MEESNKRNKKNLWFVVTGAIIGAFLAILAYNHFFIYKERQLYKMIIETSVDSADRLLGKGMTEEALTIYDSVLKILSEKKEPELYSHIKNQEGICYENLAIINNRHCLFNNSLRRDLQLLTDIDPIFQLHIIQL